VFRPADSFWNGGCTKSTQVAVDALRVGEQQPGLEQRRPGFENLRIGEYPEPAPLANVLQSAAAGLGVDPIEQIAKTGDGLDV